MFYEGDLQSGIGKAVQEAKLVVCFVTDNGEESQLWENDFLQDENIKSRLVDHAIVLRLIAGSEEAGYLAAIYPLPKTPTLVVIRNGELKEYLVSGVDKAKFVRNLFVALGGIPSQLSPAASSSSSANALGSTTTESDQTPAAVSDLLAERRARLDVHKKEQDARERAKKEAEARKRKEEQEAAAAADPKATAEAKYALMQKKRQQEAREERARILKRVEDDKAERREREEARKRQAAAKSREEEQDQPGIMRSENKRSPSECALQVRLFDGSTIRSRFPAQGSLRKDVRPWVDEKQEGDTPYTFKHILTPLPNKTIETSEEEKSLHSLGLTPNATLILVPVASFTTAYEPSGIVSRGVSTGYGLVASGFGAVTGLLGSVLGGGTAASPSEPPSNQDRGEPSNTPRSAVNNANLRTLREQNDKKDLNQFYNGNSTNFEPRRDDDGKKQD